MHSQTLPKHQPLISNLLYLPLLSIYHLNVGKVLFIISNYHVLWTVVVSGSLRRFLNFFYCFKNTLFCRRCQSTAANLRFYSITQRSSCSGPGSLLYKDDQSAWCNNNKSPQGRCGAWLITSKIFFSWISYTFFSIYDDNLPVFLLNYSKWFFS